MPETNAPCRHVNRCVQYLRGIVGSLGGRSVTLPLRALRSIGATREPRASQVLRQRARQVPNAHAAWADCYRLGSATAADTSSRMPGTPAPSIGRGAFHSAREVSVSLGCGNCVNEPAYAPSLPPSL